MAPPSKQKERNSESSSTPSKPLVILAKPPDKNKAVQGHSDNAPNSPTGGKDFKPPTVLQKSREGGDHNGSRAASPGSGTTATVTHSSSSALPKESDAFADFVKNVSQKVYHIQQKPSAAGQNVDEQKSSLPPDMAAPVKLIDESLQWCESAGEYLHDGADFYVVGVLGLQGTGKSTVMSAVNGWPVFKAQGQDVKEVGEHCTTGIDMFVTNQRVILLDVQPLLSASVMDHMIQYEKYEKKPLGGSDYYSAESTLYIQSMQLVAFLMCVCHTVISVQDWFIDPNYIRFLLSCEMLKPPKPVIQFDTKSDLFTEHFPHIVFVQNKCGRQDFLPSSVMEMQETLHCIFQSSKMKFTGSVQPDLPTDQKFLEDYEKVNLFLLPNKESSEESLELDQFLEYKGRPSYQTLSKSLSRQVLSMHRQLVTCFATSEKNWFYYASRIWDTVRKANDFNEYRRHLVSIP